MTWPYVAGLFDGEGSVYLGRVGGCGFPTVAIGQAGKRGLQLFESLKDFLDNEGIFGLYRGDKSNYAKGLRPNSIHDTMWAFRITRHNSVMAFLLKSLPYLIVKRSVAQDWLRFYKMYPKFTRAQCGQISADGRRRTGSCNRHLNRDKAVEILNQLRGGKSRQELATKYGVSYFHVRDIEIGRCWWWATGLPKFVYPKKSKAV